MTDAAYMDDMPEAVEAEPQNVVEVLRQIMAMDNVAEVLTEEELAEIAGDVVDEYAIDKASMGDWFGRMENGLKLARMIRTDRSAVGKASNVVFPLVASAALQFNARAYPAIVPPAGPVVCQVHGEDKNGQKADRAARIQEHMAWQCKSQIPEWEPSIDSLLTLLPVVGTMMRKVWWDPAKGRSCVKLCDAGAVIINDKVRSIQDAPRITEELSLYPHEIEERKRAGLFLDIEMGDATDPQGDKDAPHEFLEQHRRIDIDGDGYPEPYVVTVHREKQAVVRIVANFGDEDVHLRDPQSDGPGTERAEGVTAIMPRDYFIKYDFLPPLDGGFWGTGLGLLLGDLSHAINSTINILIDAGHRNSMGGGFIGAKDLRLKGGPTRFDFGEWKQMPFAGDDIRKGVVPLQFPEPSNVLFQMLGLLIEAGREIASIKDVVTGEVNRQMTATATVALIEQGTAVFTAAYKRIFRALDREFRLLCENNSRYLSDEEYTAFHDIVGEDGQPVMLSAEADYNLKDMDVSPAADPRQVTTMQRMARAQLLVELVPLGVDPQAALKRVLEAAQIDDADELIPEPDQLTQELAMRQAQHADQMMAFERMKAEVEIGEMLAGIEKSRADAAATMAGIDLETRQQALDAAKARLTGMLDMLKMEMDGQRRTGIVEGQPGNNGGSGPSQAIGAPAQGADLGSLLGGGSADGGIYGADQGDFGAVG